MWHRNFLREKAHFAGIDLPDSLLSLPWFALLILRDDLRQWMFGDTCYSGEQCRPLPRAMLKNPDDLRDAAGGDGRFGV